MYDLFQGFWSVIPQSHIIQELMTAHVLPSVPHPVLLVLFVSIQETIAYFKVLEIILLFSTENFFFLKLGSMPSAELSAEFELTTLRSRLELRSRVRGLTD